MAGRTRRGSPSVTVPPGTGNTAAVSSTRPSAPAPAAQGAGGTDGVVGVGRPSGRAGGRAARLPEPGRLLGVAVGRAWVVTTGLALLVGGLAIRGGAGWAAAVVGLVGLVAGAGRWNGRWLTDVAVLRVVRRAPVPTAVPAAGSGPGPAPAQVAGPDGSPLAVLPVPGGRAVVVAGAVRPGPDRSRARVDLAALLGALDGRRGSASVVELVVRTVPGPDGAVLRRSVAVVCRVATTGPDTGVRGVPSATDTRLPVAALARVSDALGEDVSVSGLDGPALTELRRATAPAVVTGGPGPTTGWAAVRTGDGWSTVWVASRLPRSVSGVAAAVDVLGRVPAAAVGVVVSAARSGSAVPAVRVAVRLTDPDRDRLEAAARALARVARRAGVRLVRQNGAHGAPGLPGGASGDPGRAAVRGLPAPRVLRGDGEPRGGGTDGVLVTPGGLRLGTAHTDGDDVVLDLSGGDVRVVVVGGVAAGRLLASRAVGPGSTVRVATGRPGSWAVPGCEVVGLGAAVGSATTPSPRGGQAAVVVQVWDGGAAPVVPGTGPVGDGADRGGQLTVVLLPFVLAGAAPILAAADVVVTQRLTAGEVDLLVRARGAGADTAAVVTGLAQRPDTDVVVLTRSAARLVDLAPTAAEVSRVGAPSRADPVS